MRTSALDPVKPCNINTARFPPSKKNGFGAVTFILFVISSYLHYSQKINRKNKSRPPHVKIENDQPYHHNDATSNPKMKNKVPSTAAVRFKTASKPRAFWRPNNCSAPPAIAPRPCDRPDMSSTTTINKTATTSRLIVAIVCIVVSSSFYLHAFYYIEVIDKTPAFKLSGRVAEPFADDFLHLVDDDEGAVVRHLDNFFEWRNLTFIDDHI